MNLCFLIETLENNTTNINNYLFEEDGLINGKQSWSCNNQFYVYWYTGDTNQWVLDGFTDVFIYSFTTSDIPLFGWQILGSIPPTQLKNISVTTGTCENNSVVDYEVNVTNPSCKCDGKIYIQPISGQPPFKFYLNEIEKTFNVISNLCYGIYNLKVKDSNQNETYKQVELTRNPNTKYFIYSNFDSTSGVLEIRVEPQIDENQQIEFDLLYNNTFSYSPNQNSALQNQIERLLVNGIEYDVIPNTTQTFQQTTLKRPCEGNSYTQLTNKVWKNITLNQNQIVKGFISSEIVANPEDTKSCYTATQNLSFDISNIKIKNCNCCEITKVINNK